MPIPALDYELIVTSPYFWGLMALAATALVLVVALREKGDGE